MNNFYSTPRTSMTVTSLDAKLITFETTLPYSEVIARLDQAVNKQGSGGILIKLRNAKSREEIERTVNAITKLENDFLYFLDIRHHPWLNTYYQIANTPCTALYTIGNPLIAQSILWYDLSAGLHIPPRLLVQEKAGGNGTMVLYQKPSSIIIVPDDGKEESEMLRKGVESLDKKLEALVRKIVGMDDKGKL